MAARAKKRSDLLTPSLASVCTIGNLSTLTYTEFDCLALLAMLKTSLVLIVLPACEKPGCPPAENVHENPVYQDYAFVTATIGFKTTEHWMYVEAWLHKYYKRTLKGYMLSRLLPLSWPPKTSQYADLLPFAVPSLVHLHLHWGLSACKTRQFEQNPPLTQPGKLHSICKTLFTQKLCSLVLIICSILVRGKCWSKVMLFKVLKAGKITMNSLIDKFNTELSKETWESLQFPIPFTLSTWMQRNPCHFHNIRSSWPRSVVVLMIM